LGIDNNKADLFKRMKIAKKIVKKLVSKIITKYAHLRNNLGFKISILGNGRFIHLRFNKLELDFAIFHMIYLILDYHYGIRILRKLVKLIKESSHFE